MPSRFLIVLLIQFICSLSLAQFPHQEIWNWAWDENAGKLFAYSSEGKVNLLLSGVPNRVTELWRLNNNQAIGIIEVENGAALYELGNESLQALKLNFDVHDLGVPIDTTSSYRLEAYTEPYLLITSVSYGSHSALLINSETQQVELLTNNLHWMPYYNCCRFTEDGETLRYGIISEDNSFRTIEIHERKLRTQQDTILLTYSGKGLLVNPDLYGERWLIGEDEGETNLAVYHLWDVEGKSNKIYHQTPTESYRAYKLWGNDLISYQPLCETACSLQVITEEDTTFTYAIPSGSSPYFVQRSENHIVIGRIDGYWQLSTNSEPTFLGYPYCTGCHLRSPISPDQRWLQVADISDYPPIHIFVWDIMNQEIAVDYQVLKDSPEPVEMIYDIDGFIINGLDDYSIMYLYSQGKPIELPYNGSGLYFDVLPDGSVLYQSYGYSEISTGIYRYSPQNDDLTPLLEEAEYIPTKDVYYLAI